jgi:glycosyltransferase involved in cell wall biosynthesis
VQRLGKIARYARRRAVHLCLGPARLLLRRSVRAQPDGTADERIFILLLSAWGMGGTTRTVENLAGYLAGQHDVEVLSLFRRREKPFFELPSGVTFTALDDRRRTAEPARRTFLRSVLRACPSALVHPADPAADQASLWTDLLLVRKLRGRSGFLLGTRPGFNAVVADLSPPGLVTVGQEHMHFVAYSRPLKRAIRRLYPRLDGLAVLTERDRSDYEGLLDRRVRLVRIPNSVRAIPGSTADPAARTVLAAGRLTSQKGFDLLLEAFARIAPSHSDWRLRICGQGRLRTDLERLAEERGLAATAELAGACRDLPGEMAKASVFVLSSRFEGFPLALLEAMSAGLAVVSFDCPTGPRDLVEDGRNGLLVPAEDVDALAAALQELLEDEELRRRLGTAAVETARDYSMDVIGPQWESFLAELVQARGSRR